MTRVDINGHSIVLMRADITTLHVDAIVNAANASLAAGGGVDGAIHRSGGPTIMQETRTMHPGGIRPGAAVATGAGNLHARFVIHAVAPRYGGGESDAKTLYSAYRESLLVAESVGAMTVAFPSLGTGACGYPVDEASAIAMRAVTAFLRGRPTRIATVTFALFSDGDYAAYRRALDDAL